MRAALNPECSVEELSSMPVAACACCCDYGTGTNRRRTMPLAVYSPDKHIRITGRTMVEIQTAANYWRSKNG